MKLSENIKKYRLRRGMTQEQLASCLGVSPQAVSKWECGDTYPDGSLLLPIAEALGVSLDMLFGNERVTAEDVSIKIRRFLMETPLEERFNTVRDICWQIEKGLFRLFDKDKMQYDPEEIKNTHMSSHILNDYGFTLISNGSSPFFSVFPETEAGYASVIRDGEEMREIFGRLSDPHTMKGVLYIMKQPCCYLFDPGLMADVCNIPDEEIEKVVEDLDALKLVVKYETDINGEKCLLLSTRQSPEITSLLLIAHEVNYGGGYCLEVSRRETPFLK